MKAVSVKSLLKYFISMALAVALLWYLFSKQDFGEFMQRLKTANYWWIFVSVFISWISHWFRALRWNLLIEPLGYPNLKTWRTFIAVMVGYVANLVVPRMGEVSRCAVLRNTDDVNMSTGIGSVLAERLIDLLCLVFLLFVALAVEFKAISNTFSYFFKGDSFVWNSGKTALVVGGIVLLIAGGYFLYVALRKRFLLSANYQKIMLFLVEMWQGFTSIKKIKRPWAFWASTIAIWACYYLMAYVMIYAIPETSHLGWNVGLTLLVMGGIGMSAPVQGGFGTYHYLVANVLVLYGLSLEIGLVFATLVHTSQTISVIVVGSLSLLMSFLIKRQKQKNATMTQNSTV